MKEGLVIQYAYFKFRCEAEDRIKSTCHPYVVENILFSRQIFDKPPGNT